MNMVKVCINTILLVLVLSAQTYCQRQPGPGLGKSPQARRPNGQNKGRMRSFDGDDDFGDGFGGGGGGDYPDYGFGSGGLVPQSQPRKKAFKDPRFRDPNYGQMKVKELPVFALTASDVGAGSDIDRFFWHVDQQSAQEDNQREQRRRMKHQRRMQRLQQQREWRRTARVQGFAAAQSQAQNYAAAQSQAQAQNYGTRRGAAPQSRAQPGRGRSILRDDGYIESRPGERPSIPLQTAVPDIPQDVLDYYEKSRQNDLRLAEAIQRREMENFMRENHERKHRLTRLPNDGFKEVATEIGEPQVNRRKGSGLDDEMDDDIRSYSLIKEGDVNVDQNDGMKKNRKNVSLAQRKAQAKKKQ